jgi:hypothetical protein
MNAIPPQPVPRRLPVGATAAAAWRLVWQSRDDLLRIAAVPLLISFCLSLATQAWRSPTALFLVVLLDWLPLTLFAVAWLRFLLHRDNAGARRLAARWSPRETKFLSRLVLINVGTGLAALLVTSLIAVALGIRLDGSGSSILLVFVAAGIAAAYLTLRLSLTLPAAAVDLAYGFRDSWRDTAACGVPLLLAMMLANLPAVAVLLLQSTPLADALPYTLLLMTDGLAYVVFAASMTVLALAFRACTGFPGRLRAVVSR